ncbi:hypothetical protein QNZ74_001148 [Vibrio parahaemolyticus]|uniref:DUF6988 family protein n=1 Tax=Vibrio TaxID=662 RepID=UPI0013734FFE|nr:hypothetical protein [Vibrio sp. V43_P6S15P86]EIJ2379575.1 hypothetical protein [Vibrio alginolyticus]ELB2201683.1 hypothetical protein [Vibrio parahaemolyticus]NAW81734.1 hypothetical protein [Vibrio sp. V43_P6S15P86]
MKIEDFETWSRYYQLQLDGVSFEPNARRRVAMGLLHLSLEHHQSILNLAKSNLFGSSFSLLRCQFESMLRGLWFLRCASDAHIDKFIGNKKLDLKVNDLIADIETTDGYQGGALQRYKAGKWKAMNDYTHGGFFQVASRTQGDEVTGRNLSEHNFWILAESCRLSLLSVLELCSIIEQPRLSRTLSSKYFEIIEKSP